MIPKNNVAYLQAAIDGDVQAAYMQRIADTDLDGIKELKRLTGVKPRFRNEDAQAIYAEQFEEFYPDFEELKEIMGIAPENDTVQECYIHALETGNIDYAERMKSFTGIAPDFSDEGMKTAVQKGYVVRIPDGLFTDPMEMKTFTGIMPDPSFEGMKEAVQECYKQYIRIQYTPGIKILEEFTGIPPSPELLKRYHKLMAPARAMRTENV